MTRAIRIATIALVVALLGSGAAHAAEFYESYDEGLRGVESKDWSVVVAKMSEAIRKNPRENKRERSYGANFFPYHPYYYRGIAYFHQGKYTEAIEDLQKALGVGRINMGTPESWVLRAEDRLRYSAGTPQPTATQVVQQPAPSQPAQSQPSPQPSQSPPSTTTRPAAQPQQPASQPSRPAAQTQQPSRPPVAAPVVAPPDAGALKAKVREALRAYFNGDFQRSEIALELLSKDQESNAMIWAFLGASRFNSFVLSGETNGAMKAGAEEAFRTVRRLEPALRLNARYFSPRVRSFYESID